MEDLENITDYEMLIIKRREIIRILKEVVLLEDKLMPLKLDMSKIVLSTKYGKKYHTDHCQYVRKEARTITLQKALSEGLEECKICIRKKRINK